MKQISFLINTSVNTLDHFKLLIESLKINLKGRDHEVLVFIDSDNEGTLEWLRGQKKHFVDLRIITHKLKPCVGYSRNNNLLVELAKHDIVSYLQSDMVISPNYDEDVLLELEDNCILSATRVEPPLHGESPLVVTKNFGVDPLNFNMQEWNEFSKSIKQNKTVEYFFAPITFYKRVWLEIGGYDTQFRRGREDSDLLQRFVRRGVKIKQTFNANVYHFSCVASRGKNWFEGNNEAVKKRLEIQKLADSIEMRRFLKKWGGFHHGNEKLSKLDCDLIVKNTGHTNPSIIAQLETYVSRVWLNSEEDKKRVASLFENQHEPANWLLNFTEEDWNFAKQFYNQVGLDSIYKVGIPKDYNVLIELDLSNVDFSKDEFISNVGNLYKIVGDSEPGVYELGCARIDVVKVVDCTESNTVVNNPKFDMSLLKIE